VPCKWDEAWPFREGVAKVQSNKRLGLIDQSGNIIVPCTWRNMGEMSEGLISVMDESGKCGYIDKTGKVVIPCQWRQAWDFNGGLAVVQNKNHRLGFIDKSGHVVIPCRWKRVNLFNGNLAKVSDTRRFPFGFKWVYIDRKGNIVREE
jgi:ribosome biogenesis protein Tsr3